MTFLRVSVALHSRLLLHDVEVRDLAIHTFQSALSTRGVKKKCLSALTNIHVDVKRARHSCSLKYRNCQRHVTTRLRLHHLRKTPLFSVDNPLLSLSKRKRKTKSTYVAIIVENASP